MAHARLSRSTLSKLPASTSASSAKTLDLWCKKAMQAETSLEDFWAMICHRRVFGI
jgi:hypothetical protein